MGGTDPVWNVSSTWPGAKESGGSTRDVCPDSTGFVSRWRWPSLSLIQFKIYSRKFGLKLDAQSETLTIIIIYLEVTDYLIKCDLPVFT